MEKIKTWWDSPCCEPPDRHDGEKVCTCDECGEWIYEQDFLYRIGGGVYCEHCVKDARETA